MTLYSFVIPTWRRHEEVNELLNSLTELKYSSFEVIISDNSPDTSLKDLVLSFNNKLSISYIYEKGIGASQARNIGVKQAKGEYVVFVDSDCIVPPDYLNITDEYIKKENPDAWGGPDKAADDFNPLQKAISYAMTSFFTTGGIRGGRNHAKRYQPRSFNMGVRKSVFERIDGFNKDLKVSEDIDLSIRLYNEGYRVRLIEEAWVYHKRRVSFLKFFRQANSFGAGRYRLNRIHNNALKLVHMLPSCFVLYLILGTILALFSKKLAILWIASLLLYSLIIFIDSAIKHRSIRVALISIIAAFVMLIAYGSGMLREIIKSHLNNYNLLN